MLKIFIPIVFSIGFIACSDETAKSAEDFKNSASKFAKTATAELADSVKAKASETAKAVRNKGADLADETAKALRQ